MKVALFLDSRKESGGEFQHLLFTLENIKRLNKKKFDFVIICLSKKLELNLENSGFKTLYFSLNFFQRFICYLRNYGSLSRRIKKYFFFNNKFENFLLRNAINLVYFLSPSQYSLYMENTKFIISVPDVDHREYLEFPEIVDNDEYFRKNEIFTNSLPRALAVITNSEIIRKRLKNYYNVSLNRIHIINFRPSLAVNNFNLDNIDKKKNEEIINNFKLPKNYIFYPAMYLPHKNHKTIIDMLNILKFEKNIDIELVFSGSDIGYKKKLIDYSKKKNIFENIRFLNFVDNETLPYLYNNSKMIVFPALAGPTFIPPLEAFKLKKPVIFTYSEGIKEVYGEAVLYADPLNAEELASKAEKIYSNESLRLELIKNGEAKIKEIEETNDYEKLFDILENYKKIKTTWDLH